VLRAVGSSDDEGLKLSPASRASGKERSAMPSPSSSRLSSAGPVGVDPVAAGRELLLSLPVIVRVVLRAGRTGDRVLSEGSIVEASRRDGAMAESAAGGRESVRERRPAQQEGGGAAAQLRARALTQARPLLDCD